MMPRKERQKILESGLKRFKNGIAEIYEINPFEFVGYDLSMVTFPDDAQFFQNITGKYIEDCIMPEMDLSKYNWDGVFFNKVRFTKNTKLPKDRDFFQRLHFKCIYGCHMPEADYSIYDMNGVNIQFAVFTKTSKLPNNHDFMVNLADKSIMGAEFPDGDYSHMDFTGINLFGAKFTESSLLPPDTELFQKARIQYLETMTLPDSTINNLPFYNLDGIRFNVQEMKIPNNIRSILEAKYKNSDADFHQTKASTPEVIVHEKTFSKPSMDELIDAVKEFKSLIGQVGSAFQPQKINVEFDSPTSVVMNRRKTKELTKMQVNFFITDDNVLAYTFYNATGYRITYIDYRNIVKMSIVGNKKAANQGASLLNFFRKYHPNAWSEARNDVNRYFRYIFEGPEAKIIDIDQEMSKYGFHNYESSVRNAFNKATKYSTSSYGHTSPRSLEISEASETRINAWLTYQFSRQSEKKRDKYYYMISPGILAFPQLD